MPISALPTAPARTDPPDTFISRADAFVGALSTFVTEANALETNVNAKEASATSSAASALDSKNAAATSATTAVNATNYTATSDTSLSLTAGAKAITLNQTGKDFANGDSVTLVRRSDNTKRMKGAVSLADMVAKTMTVTVAASDIEGSGGPYTDWFVMLSALDPAAPVKALAIAFAVAL